MKPDPHAGHAAATTAPSGTAMAGAAAPTGAAALSALPDPPKKNSALLVVILWLLGLLAVGIAGVYCYELPGMRHREAKALLDAIPITYRVATKRDPDTDKVVQASLINPVTKQDTHKLEYTAYVGEVAGDHADLQARQNFIALCDLCGRDPKTAMEIIRSGLDSPMDQSGYRRRLVANELLIFLRDARDRFPNDPAMQLTMDDLYKVAQTVHAEQFVTGSARRAADLLQLFLAFPEEFPSQIPIVDHDPSGKFALARVAYLVESEYDGHKFREPFVEQGPDILLLLDTYKIVNFTWDESIKRFRYVGKVPTPDTSSPEQPTGPSPVSGLSGSGADVPTPTVPPPTPAPVPAN